MYDVAIIGAGAVGSSIARELSKFKLNLCVIEKDSDVSNGTSKANSGIVHGGYDSKYGTLKAKLNVVGNSMFEELDKQLNFGFNKCGSFVLGFDEEDLHEIKRLYTNGKKNGVEVQIVQRDFILQKEPNINPEVKFALYCPTAGIISPWEYAIAMAENAAINGVDFFLSNKVNSIEKNIDYFSIYTNEMIITSRYIINSAGLYADTISKMAGADDFNITPRKGEYHLFDKEIGSTVNSVLFQTPKKGSKGVLVTPTFHGNMMIGPNAQFVEDKEDLSTTPEGLGEVSHRAEKTIPSIDYSKVITQFSGLRASTENHDFIISESSVPHFINVAGIDSPGLSSSPAIAVLVREILENSGLILEEDPSFKENISHITNMNSLSMEEKNIMIQKDSQYGRIICRCESITQGEIVEALHRPIPATTVDGIKRRVRAGAGRCQGGFCLPRVVDIIQKELDISIFDIKKSDENSYILVDKTKSCLEEVKND